METPGRNEPHILKETRTECTCDITRDGSGGYGRTLNLTCPVHAMIRRPYSGFTDSEEG